MPEGESPEQDMKYLFIARHGNYDSDYSLSDHGREQMKKLGESFRTILGENNHQIQILSSSAKRGIESAEVLASELGIDDFEKFDYLWTGGDSPWKRRYGDMPKVHELVSERRNQADALILVSHLELSEDYPTHFMGEEYGKSTYLGQIGKGQSYLLNKENREWIVLPAGSVVHKIE